MTKFTHTDFNIDEIAANGYGRIAFKIKGFWSNEMITMYVRENYAFNSPSEVSYHWDIEISTSSGGRDPKELKCNLLAAENYAAALNTAVEIGFDFRQAEERMTAIRSKVRAEEAAIREDEKREEEALFEKDTPLGEDLATHLIEKNIAKLKAERESISIPFFRRGDDKFCHVYMELTRQNRVSVYDNCGRRISKDNAIEILAKQSHRTYVTNYVK